MLWKTLLATLVVLTLRNGVAYECDVPDEWEFKAAQMLDREQRSTPDDLEGSLASFHLEEDASELEDGQSYDDEEETPRYDNDLDSFDLNDGSQDYARMVPVDSLDDNWDNLENNDEDYENDHRRFRRSLEYGFNNDWDQSSFNYDQGAFEDNVENSLEAYGNDDLTYNQNVGGSSHFDTREDGQHGMTQDLFVNTAQGSLWPEGVVKYEFDRSLTPGDTEEVRKAFREYESKTCIRFQQRAPREHAYTRIMVNNSVCGVAHICRLGIPQFTQFGKGCRKKSVMVHELGHTLCLLHEHQRQDRDKYVGFYQNCTTKKLVPPVIPRSDGVVMGLYDYSSQMHYGCNWCSGGWPKSNVKECGMDVIQGLSVFDADGVNALYNCQGCLRHRWLAMTTLRFSNDRDLASFAGRSKRIPGFHPCRGFSIPGNFGVGSYDRRRGSCDVVFGGKVASVQAAAAEVLAIPGGLAQSGSMYQPIPATAGGPPPSGAVPAVLGVGGRIMGFVAVFKPSPMEMVFGTVWFNGKILSPAEFPVKGRPVVQKKFFIITCKNNGNSGPGGRGGPISQGPSSGRSPVGTPTSPISRPPPGGPLGIRPTPRPGQPLSPPGSPDPRTCPSTPWRQTPQPPYPGPVPPYGQRPPQTRVEPPSYFPPWFERPRPPPFYEPSIPFGQSWGSPPIFGGRGGVSVSVAWNKQRDDTSGSGDSKQMDLQTVDDEAGENQTSDESTGWLDQNNFETGSYQPSTNNGGTAFPQFPTEEHSDTSGFNIPSTSQSSQWTPTEQPPFGNNWAPDFQQASVDKTAQGMTDQYFQQTGDFQTFTPGANYDNQRPTEEPWNQYKFDQNSASSHISSQPANNFQNSLFQENTPSVGSFQVGSFDTGTSQDHSTGFPNQFTDNFSSQSFLPTYNTESRDDDKEFSQNDWEQFSYQG